MTGTVEMLPAGAFGVDFSFGRPALEDMLTLGVQFCSRYVCIDNALTHDKLWTLDQLRFYADAGILAMVNYEQGEYTTLGGETAGRKHGKVAADWRHYLGMPAELVMPISTDQGVVASQYPAIADFTAAFIDEGGGPVGCYHGTALAAYLEARGLNDLTWMAMATSWSPGGDENHETPAVHVRQKGYVLNGSCDANYVRKPTPFWNFNGTPPEQPKPDPVHRETDVVIITNSEPYPDGAGGSIAIGGIFFALMPDGSKRHIEQWAEIVARVDDGAVIRPQTTGNIQSLPGYAPVSGGTSGGGLTADEVKAIIDSTFLTTG